MPSCDLNVVHQALNEGLHKGALIHEKSGTALPVEVITAEADRLLAIVQCQESDLERLHPGVKVRVELPRESSVVWVQGKVIESRAETSCELVELDILCTCAEVRQRRMDVRIESECRVRIAGSQGGWEDTRSLNVSAGGALVVSESAAKVGERVDVEFELGGELFRCQAEVVRRGVKVNGAVSRTNAALKFLGLTEEQSAKIRLFVLGEQARNKADRRR